MANILQICADIMNLFLFFLLAVQMHSVAPVIHTLEYFITASSGVPNFPEFVSAAYIDGMEMYRYDSNNSSKTEFKQEWMNNILEAEPHYEKTITDHNVVAQQIYKENIETLQKRSNQTGGVHILQWMSGCEWDDETDEVRGWDQDGYDGEDYISLDMETWTFTAAKRTAFSDKVQWENDQLLLDYNKHYFTVGCPSFLKSYLNYGKEVLMRKELPEVFLLQKTQFSPVSCFATGFYPASAKLFWRKGGQQLFENVEHGEMLPNHDGTFQMSVDLKVEVTADVEGEYECVFQLSGVEEDLVTKLERRSILSNPMLPEVFLLQKTPSSPVSCFATGFYPASAKMFWRKGDEQLFENVEHGEMLPNHDGTFQMSVDLKVEVTADVEGEYECVFQLSGVEEDLVTKLERRSILSNPSHLSVALAATAAVATAAALIFIVRRHRKRQAQHDPAARQAGAEPLRERDG
ncbi:major histocompatibility complex class I-related gene protein-like isoform X2 [Entelurus aequoreus]|uniref:major histocompatibility complex class I-related gene protein-like isoform X2 n=1 Tax=Entelurus aequoreus TaxID=161455 RepID=UPI002B1D3E33|nr:major histocompatibility complex class I-related gene protein-like isoform X2 [Entelurus aequoreus]